ncbi:tripartite tricarboxylate transporter permease [Actibacterium pelagium]|uniref:Membrane protein n=1 Tax=Actibacterium pelagium TaxID=2029103 RepID=A0A917AKJ3_9RHOB|nr:tripartite tricarboxylate transporter permease [Actibacterium pelagium]GGE59073.1 membrane protein [Actibacterium pelagium]
MDLLFSAVTDLLEPTRFLLLVLGVCLGLIVGVIPGLGGPFGLTILIPVTYSLDPVSAMALMLGMAAVTTTSDTIPAVLLGIPGTVGSAATVLDGHALAKKGQATRAFGAAYLSSLIGGLFGALALAMVLPLMRPLILSLNFGDLLAISIFGLTLVALLSGRNPGKGIIAALLGALLSFIGLDPFESSERWTFGSIYLWDGLPMATVFLGLFGLAELTALLARGRIQIEDVPPKRTDIIRGFKDTVANWPLVLRCSGIGAILGAIPGIGGSVIDWVAYGHAARRPGAGGPFGDGNIRGVIAPESANNAKEGGALVPTLAFGIPGSATMAILLGAFTIYGLEPGPQMLEQNSQLMIAMILTLAIANVIGAAFCLGATRQLARLAQTKAEVLVPLVLVFVLLGAFQHGKAGSDFLILFAFGLLGIFMRRLTWPRPAFVLGFVLGPSLERFFFLTYQVSGWDWVTQPLVVLLLSLTAAALFRQMKGWRIARNTSEPRHHLRADFFFALILTGIAVYGLFTTFRMPFAAALFPAAVCALMLTGGVFVISSHLLNRSAKTASERLLKKSDLTFLSGVLCLSLTILTFGHLIGPALFIGLAGIWFKVQSPWATLLSMAGTSAVIFLVFDLLVSQAWPEPWLASIF